MVKLAQSRLLPLSKSDISASFCGVQQIAAISLLMFEKVINRVFDFGCRGVTR